MRRTILAAVTAGIALFAIGTPVAVAGDTGLPKDPQAKGYIGLCDETGHNVTGGSIDTKPFIWKAVSSTAPPAQFQGTGQNAVLNAYQPRPQIPPSEWSGLSLTGASFYVDKPHPAIQATYGDLSLAQFMSTFPPLVNGLFVLRVHYGKRDVGLYSASYPTTTIQVVGRRWKVVSGGTVDCGASKAISLEQMTGAVSKAQFTPRSTAPTAQTVVGGANDSKPGTISQAPGKGPGTSAAPTVASGSAGGGSAAGSTGGASPAASSHSSDSSNGWIWFVVVPAFVVLVLAVLLWRRRSFTTPPAPTA